jgi:hypothetical protein
LRHSIALKVLIGLVTVLGVVHSLGAQTESDPLLRVTRELTTIQLQVHLGILDEQSALEALQGAPTAEEVAKLAVLIHDGYAKIRAAENGLRYRASTPGMFANPLHGMIGEALNTAMHHIREAHMATQAAETGDVSKVKQAMEHLETAIVIVQQAMSLF